MTAGEPALRPEAARVQLDNTRALLAALAEKREALRVRASDAEAQVREAATDREPDEIHGGSRALRGLQTQPAEVVDVLGRRLTAEILPDHRMWLRGDGPGGRLDRRAHREEHDAERDRDLGKAREHRRRAEPSGRSLFGRGTERHAHPAGREHRPTRAERRERPGQRDVDRDGVTQGVRALGARARVLLDVRPLP